MREDSNKYKQVSKWSKTCYRVSQLREAWPPGKHKSFRISPPRTGRLARTCLGFKLVNSSDTRCRITNCDFLNQHFLVVGNAVAKVLQTSSLPFLFLAAQLLHCSTTLRKAHTRQLEGGRHVPHSACTK